MKNEFLIMGLFALFTVFFNFSCSKDLLTADGYNEQDDLVNSTVAKSMNDDHDVQTYSIDEEIFASLIISKAESTPGDFIIKSKSTDNGIVLKVINVEDYITEPTRLKSSSEDGVANAWIHWGIVKNIFDAKKFGSYCAELYEGKTFETRYETIPNSTDRNAFHRLGQ